MQKTQNSRRMIWKGGRIAENGSCIDCSGQWKNDSDRAKKWISTTTTTTPVIKVYIALNTFRIIFSVFNILRFGSELNLKVLIKEF